MKISEWTACYDDSWKSLITDESFSHPAKFSRGLIQRIYAHCLERDYLRQGDTVVDPFGGVALGGIIGAGLGLRWIGCELEEKFVRLGNANIDLHRRKWEAFGDPVPVMVQGDSRNLSSILRSICNDCQEACFRPVRNLQQTSGEKTKRPEKEQERNNFLLERVQADGECATDIQSVEGASIDTIERTQELSPSGGTRSKRKGKRHVQARTNGGNVHLPQEEKNPVRDMRIEGNAGNTSQEQRPLRQPGRKSPDALQFMSHEANDGTPPQGETRTCPVCKKQWSCGLEPVERLREVLGPVMPSGSVDSVIGSPPFSSDQPCASQTRTLKEGGYNAIKGPTKRDATLTGDTEGQLGSLPPGSVDAVLSSPPYAGSLNSETHGIDFSKADPKWGGRETPGRAAASERHSSDRCYGDGPGQLGAMPEGDVDAVIGSPPFIDARQDTTPSVKGESAPTKHDPENWSGADVVLSSPPYAASLKGDNSASETAEESHAKRSDPKQGGSLGQSCRHQGYGSKENLGNLPAGDVAAVVSSPPYAESSVGEGTTRFLSRLDAGDSKAANVRADNYGSSDGQLAALPAGCVEGVVSSPPFMLSDNRNPSASCPRQGQSVGPHYSDESPTNPTVGGDRTSDDAKEAQRCRAEKVKNLGEIVSVGNGGTLVNVGTFWSAARTIVRECHAILKSGGIAVWVVKAFVRDGKIQDFPGDWRRLCEHVGFETLEEIHASLVKEESHPSLFGGEETTRKERKSFFRRLHEKRRPDLAIDHEVVWIMRKLP